MRKGMLIAAALVASGLALVLTGQDIVANSGGNGTRLAATNYRSCVQCRAVEGCRVCVGGGDANTCQTDGTCQNCVESGICNASDLFERTGAKQSQPVMRLSADKLREIAAVHPRFAATLARLNASGIREQPYRVYWTPVEMTSADAERYIRPSARSQAISASLLEEVRRVNLLIEQGLASDIVYTVTVEETGASTRVLRLEVEKGSTLDPAYTTLELKQTAAPKPGTEWHVY